MAQLVVAAAGAAIGGATLGTGVVALGMTGTAIGWMAGSLIGSMFAKGPDGPKIEDGKFSSSIYGQPIPLNYGTMRHATQIAWWSGLIVRTEEVGGKGGGGADIERARMNLLLAVCEGPQAGVLRIWANGRLIATFNGSTYELDKDVLPSGDVRVYLGTEDQMPDPTYEEVVGSENAVPYRGMVMVAIDGLEGEQVGNRPPNIECEVASVVSGGGCYEGENPTFGAAAKNGPENVPTLGIGNGAQIAVDAARQRVYAIDTDDAAGEYGFAVYDVSGDTPELVQWVDTGPMVGPVGGSDPSPLAILYVEDADEILLFRYAWNDTLDSPMFRVYDAETLTYKRASTSKNPSSTYPGLATYNPVAGTVSWWGSNIVVSQRQLLRLSDGVRLSTGPNGIYNGFFVTPGGDAAFLFERDATVTSAWILEYNLATDVIGSPISGGTFGSVGEHVSYTWDDRRSLLYVMYTGFVAVVDPSANAVVQTVDLTALGVGGNSEATIVYAPEIDEVMITASLGWTVTPGIWRLRPTDWSVRAYCPAPGAVVGSSGPAGWLAGADRIVTGYGPGVYMWRLATAQAIGGPVALQTIVEDVSLRAGLPAENLDATAGTDLVAGFKVARQMSAKAVIDSLRPVYFFDMPEVGEQLVLTKRGAAPVVALSAGELGASRFQSSRAEPVAPYEIEHIEAQEIPRRLEVSYVDFAADYDPGVQSAERQVGESRSPLQVEAPVVLSAEEAARVAWANLLLAHSSNGNVRLALSHAHDALSPSDAIEIPHASGDTIRVRIEQITRARPLVEIEGVIEDASVYEQFMGGILRYQGPQNGAIGEVGDTILVLLDIPPLRDQDDSLLVYAAMARADFDAYWPGGTLYKSSDGGSSYQAQFSTGTGATIGRTTSPLADFTAGNVWDDVSQLDVIVTSGSFASASDTAVLNGANAVAVQAGTDWEIVQFADAELIGTNTWRLTRLLRGRIGTERCIDGHASNDRVVALTGALRTVDQQLSERGTTRQYKGVTSNQPVADAGPQPLTLVGRSLMPLSPVHITAGRATNNDVVIDWTRRARINADWPWDGNDIPLDEPSERYEVEIFDGSSVVRVLTANTSQVTYTAAQQSADFGGSMPTDFVVAVYQMSSRVGRGWPGLGQFGLPGYSYEPDVTPVPVPTPGGGSGTTTPPATSNDARRFGWPMWFDGKWWAAPENETVAVDLGAGADQFVRSSAAKWAKDRYRTRVNYDVTNGSAPGVWSDGWHVGRGTTWLATDGTVLAGTFADDPEFVTIYNSGVPNHNIQAWAPGWTGPKIARRRMPGAGESVWYVQDIIDAWGMPTDTNALGQIFSGATDGTTWGFIARQSDNDTDPFMVTTADFVSWTAIRLEAASGLPSTIRQAHIMHNGAEWVLFQMTAGLQTEIYTSADLSSWTKETDPGWVGPFAASPDAGRAYINRVVASWNGDWYYIHRRYAPDDTQIYKSSDLVTWTLADEPTAMLASNHQMLLTSGKLGWWDGNATFIGTTDGTTWTETATSVMVDELSMLSRGVAVPSAPQSLPADVVCATQADVGQGGALFKLSDFADTSPTFSLQPVTTYGAELRTIGQRLGGEFREGGRVIDGVDQTVLFRAFTTGKRYYEVRWESLAGVSLREHAEAGAGDVCYSWFGGVYSPSLMIGSAGYNAHLSGPRLNDGDVLGVGVDADARTVTFWANGSLVGTVSVGVTSFGYTLDTLGAVIRPNLLGVRARVNSHSDELIYPLPAGYTAWND